MTACVMRETTAQTTMAMQTTELPARTGGASILINITPTAAPTAGTSGARLRKKGYMQQMFTRISVRAELIHGAQNELYLQRADHWLKTKGKRTATCRRATEEGRRVSGGGGRHGDALGDDEGGRTRCVVLSRSGGHWARAERA